MSSQNEAIFPIVTFNPITENWLCLGTGFFINPVGAFVTAKHLLILDGKQMEKTLYGVHNVDNKEYHLRPITKIIPHENADIMIGILGMRRLPSKENVKTNNSQYFALDLDPLENGEIISTFAYPNTERTDLKTGETEFLFTGVKSFGKVIDFCEYGSFKVKNRCYQTSMDIQGGASGGPVFKNGYVIAINSSSFNLMPGEEPISYITPIDFILDLNIIENNKTISVKELIDNQHIKIK